jgi:hypothetical protein
MDWQGIVKFLGGSAVIVAAITWIVKSSVAQLFKRDIENLKAGLARIDRIESELLKARGDAYGKVWELTGSLNLFGPAREVTSEKLSADLSDWYFAHGWAITQDSKESYFLVQEVLSFLILRSIPFRRPPDEDLYSGGERPVMVLDRLRKEEFQIAITHSGHTVDELGRCVSEWKKGEKTTGGGERSPERAWILAQFVMSEFRNRLVTELGSRKNVDVARTGRPGERAFGANRD